MYYTMRRLYYTMLYYMILYYNILQYIILYYMDYYVVHSRVCRFVIYKWLFLAGYKSALLPLALWAMRLTSHLASDESRRNNYSKTMFDRIVNVL